MFISVVWNKDHSFLPPNKFYQLYQAGKLLNISSSKLLCEHWSMSFLSSSAVVWPSEVSSSQYTEPASWTSDKCIRYFVYTAAKLPLFETQIMSAYMILKSCLLFITWGIGWTLSHMDAESLPRLLITVCARPRPRSPLPALLQFDFDVPICK